jgi:hypothetical protein
MIKGIPAIAKVSVSRRTRTGKTKGRRTRTHGRTK